MPTFRAAPAALVAALLLGTAAARAADPPAPGTASPAAAADAKIAPWLRGRLDKAATPFLVLLEDTGGTRARAGHDTPAQAYDRLRAAARQRQAPLLRDLAAAGLSARPFWIVNAVLVRGDLALARRLAARPEVRRVVGNPRVLAHRRTLGAGPAAPAAIEWGVTMVRAPEAWARTGGEGIVVASMDTGVDWDHPALLRQYRGRDPLSGAVDHRWSWHDAVDPTNPVPLDDDGHGTHTVGTMVGDDGAGRQIGVAPAARWIGCRNMDHGWGSPALYLDCMEWTLAPYPAGGDPLADGRPDMAPHVVNNSWGCPPEEGCDPDTLRTAFARMHEAGIFHIAAAGNAGPSCGTVEDPPPIYDAVFAVAAVDSARTLAGFSARGPVLVDGSNLAKPDVAAPGVGIVSAANGGGYRSSSGTSMASPHVAGVAALLWSDRPALRGRVALSRCILERSAVRTVQNGIAGQACGGVTMSTWPNPMAGWGLLDAQAALTLPNGDGDLAPDACDCAAADGGAFAAPTTVVGLAFAPGRDDLLGWSSQAADAGSGTRYDLVRGDVERLRADGGIAAASCHAPGLVQPGTTDAEAPPPGRAFYYVARAANACATADWGRATGGTPRENTSCNP